MIRLIQKYKKVVIWALVLICTFVILALFMVPRHTILSIVPFREHVRFLIDHFDKVIHFSAYAIIGTVIILFLHFFNKLSYIKNSSFTILLGGAFGAITEVIQGVVPNRTASIEDATANIAGILFGIIIVNFIAIASRIISGHRIKIS